MVTAVPPSKKPMLGEIAETVGATPPDAGFHVDMIGKKLTRWLVLRNRAATT